MYYCESNDITKSIAGTDPEVFSVKTSRSQMELLGAFARFRHANDIGPVVYDFQTPQVPTQEDVEQLLGKALDVRSPLAILGQPRLRAQEQVSERGEANARHLGARWPPPASS